MFIVNLARKKRAVGTDYKSASSGAASNVIENSTTDESTKHLLNAEFTGAKNALEKKEEEKNK